MNRHERRKAKKMLTRPSDEARPLMDALLRSAAEQTPCDGMTARERYDGLKELWVKGFVDIASEMVPTGFCIEIIPRDRSEDERAAIERQRTAFLVTEH
jgi:hypothetical protein